MTARILRTIACVLALGALAGLAGAVTVSGIESCGALAGTAPPAALSSWLVSIATCLIGVAGLGLSLGGLSVLATRLGPEASPMARLSATLVPSWWRGLVLAGCGLGLVAVPPAATAAPTGTSVPAATAAAIAAVSHADIGSGRCPPACSATLHGLPLPELPLAQEGANIVTVRQGDSLWSIASELLPTGAADADVLELVRHIYTTNRDVIGPDPDLIFPGTHLTVSGGNP